MRSTLIASGLALAALCSACVYDDSGVDVSDTQPLKTRLDRRAVLDLEDTSNISVTATALGGITLPGVQAHITKGKAAVRTTREGVIVVEALEIELDDVIIPAGIISPASYRLTDLQLRLGLQMTSTPVWSADGRHAAGRGRADLLLRSSVETPDGVFPLATGRLDDTPFEIEIYLDDFDDVHARLTTAVAGQMSSFLDRLALSDLTMAIDASTATVD